MSAPISRRPVRSYVIREGRMTKGQERALDTLWTLYGVAAGEQPLDLAALFGRDAPTVLEIGFGDGGALRALAAARPEWNFLGIEVHRPGVGNLLLRLDRDGIDNVRVMQEDAVGILARNVPPDSLRRIHLFFPDPWPKKRHRKRRILNPAFAELSASRLEPKQGVFHFATDWEDYAEQGLAVLADCPAFVNVGGADGYAPRPEWRPETRFERRGLSRGHAVRDVLVRRA